MNSQCMDQIAAFIQSQSLEVGDRLPGERQLALRLGVSRNTVREALLNLAARGHIEIRRRSGCYVTAPADSEGWKILRKDPASARPAHEAFLALCRPVAALAALHCDAERVRRLETITSRLGRMLVNHDAGRTASEYVRFFMVLAGSTGNSYLELLMKEIAASPALFQSHAEMLKEDIEAFFALHINLLQALQDRDPRRAASYAPRCVSALAFMLGRRDWSPLAVEGGGES